MSKVYKCKIRATGETVYLRKINMNNAIMCKRSSGGHYHKAGTIPAGEEMFFDGGRKIYLTHQIEILEECTNQSLQQQTPGQKQH